MQPDDAFIGMARESINEKAGAAKECIGRALHPGEGVLHLIGSRQELMFADIERLPFRKMNRQDLPSPIAAKTDASGAALPGVSLTATNDATGSNRTVVTEADGTYKFLSLQPGTYTVVADLSGFGTVTTKGVQVQVATERTMNVTLKPAAVSEQITVTAEAPLVATSPSVGTGRRVSARSSVRRSSRTCRSTAGSSRTSDRWRRERRSRSTRTRRSRAS